MSLNDGSPLSATLPLCDGTHIGGVAGFVTLALARRLYPTQPTRGLLPSEKPLMLNELNDFSREAFGSLELGSSALLDLCLRLEVVLVKLQDQHPSESATLRLIEELNRLGHTLEPDEIPGLDHCFSGPLEGRGVLQIRSAGTWFSVRVQSACE